MQLNSAIGQALRQATVLVLLTVMWVPAALADESESQAPPGSFLNTTNADQPAAPVQSQAQGAPAELGDPMIQPTAQEFKVTPDLPQSDSQLTQPVQPVRASNQAFTGVPAWPGQMPSQPMNSMTSPQSQQMPAVWPDRSPGTVQNLQSQPTGMTPQQPAQYRGWSQPNPGQPSWGSASGPNQAVQPAGAANPPAWPQQNYQAGMPQQYSQQNYQVATPQQYPQQSYQAGMPQQNPQQNYQAGMGQQYPQQSYQAGTAQQYPPQNYQGGMAQQYPPQNYQGGMAQQYPPQNYQGGMTQQYPQQNYQAGMPQQDPQQNPQAVAWPNQANQGSLAGLVQHTVPAPGSGNSWPDGYPSWNDVKGDNSTNSQSNSMLGNSPMDSSGQYNPLGGMMPTSGTSLGGLGSPGMGGLSMLLGTALGAWLGSRMGNTNTVNPSMTASAANPLSGLLGGSTGSSLLGSSAATNPLASLLSGQTGTMTGNPLAGLFNNQMLSGLLGGGAANPLTGGINNFSTNPLTTGQSSGIIGNQITRSSVLPNMGSFRTPFYGGVLNTALNRGIYQSLYSGLGRLRF